MGYISKCLAVLATAVAGVSIQAHAAYPDKPIRLVVPYPAGGSTDVMGRAVARAMSAHLGQQVVVENKSGAATVIGVDAVARSPNDGYTILLATATSFAINPHIVEKLPYRLEEFVPIGFISEAPVMLVSTASKAAKNLKELTARFKAGGQPVTVATTGKGGFSHLTALMYFNAIGVPVNDVPYRGESPAIQDVVSGQVSYYFGSLPGTLGHVASGRLKGYAVTTEVRSPAAPDVPTFTELGYGKVVATSWYGLAAPAGTSAEVVKVLGDALDKALDDKDVQAQFARDGAISKKMGSKEFASYIRTDSARWEQVIRAANIQATALK